MEIADKAPIFSCLDVHILQETALWSSIEFVRNFYEDKEDFHQLFLMNEKQSVVYYVEKKFVNIEKELFSRHMGGEGVLGSVMNRFDLDAREIDRLYALNGYSDIRAQSTERLLELLSQLVHIMQPKLSFGIDKVSCERFFDEKDHQAFVGFWEKLQEPVHDSFKQCWDKRAFQSFIDGEGISLNRLASDKLSRQDI